jgi:hypothetical protein
VELVRLAARDRTDAAIAKPEPPFVRVDELGGQFPGMFDHRTPVTAMTAGGDRVLS